MIHAEAIGNWIRDHHEVKRSTTDAHDLREAFTWAADMLNEGADYVAIWVSGDRNVPQKVTKETYFDVRKVWV